MFHTNKMPKIIVFRVVIEGTAPTEGPPTACHGKRPSGPKHPERPPSRLSPNAPAPASSFHTCESHFRAHICARLPVQPWETPFLSQAPRAPAFSSSPERPSVCIQLPHLRKPFSGAYLRPSACPATGSVLPVPSAPSARLLVYLRTPERPHPASPPAKAIFGRIFAPVSSFKPRLL